MTYTLPELTYDYGALDPSISGEIMELHHSKHHAAYVAGANQALEQMAEARDSGNFGTLPKLEKDLAFHLGGHTNHSIFWKNMGPDSPDRPSGELAAAIDEFFGDFDKFVAQFNAAALSIQGSGWALLSWDAVASRLNINQLYDQQGNVAVLTTPLLMLDMWEHAFYLDYKNVKGDYVKAFWNIVNWSDVEMRFNAAKKHASSLLLG